MTTTHTQPVPTPAPEMSVSVLPEPGSTPERYTVVIFMGDHEAIIANWLTLEVAEEVAEEVAMHNGLHLQDEHHPDPVIGRVVYRDLWEPEPPTWEAQMRSKYPIQRERPLNPFAR